MLHRHRLGVGARLGSRDEQGTGGLSPAAIAQVSKYHSKSRQRPTPTEQTAETASIQLLPLPSSAAVIRPAEAVGWYTVLSSPVKFLRVDRPLGHVPVWGVCRLCIAK